MPYPFKHVLLVGATSGIGAALADRFIQEGSKVTAVGRRTDRLDAFVAKHGKDKASAIQYDITDSKGLDNFVKTATIDYPEIDFVILNAGLQQPFDLGKPETVDLAKFHSEIHTNFTCLVNLSMKLLPFLMTKRSTLAFTTSHLGYIPAVGMPAYSVSKSALQTFILVLRDSVRNSSVKIVDIWPPAVQTELHDYLGKERGRSFGMPLADFTDAAFEGLKKGTPEVLVGTGLMPSELESPVVEQRRQLTHAGAEMIRKMHAETGAGK